MASSAGDEKPEGGASVPARPLGWLVDTHSHLADPAFDADRVEVGERSRAAGVALVLVGYDLATSRLSVDLADPAAGRFAAVGIHPNSWTTDSADELAEIRRLAVDPRVVAIGETGLDFYRAHVEADRQVELLRAHLTLADELGKPVILHDREAHRALLDVLLPWAASRRADWRTTRPPGVFHCFSGDAALAVEAEQAGFLVSFAGNLTYSKSTLLAESAGRLRTDSLLVETDCPYLAPEGRRGKRNEPVNVELVASRLAVIRGVSLDEVAATTSANARRLFGVDFSGERPG